MGDILVSLRCNDQERARGQSEYVLCVECGTGPCLKTAQEALERELSNRIDYDARERRNRIAEGAFFSLLTNFALTPSVMAKDAVEYADALIAHLDANPPKITGGE